MDELPGQERVLENCLTKTETIQAQVRTKQEQMDEIMNRLFDDPKFKKAVCEAVERQS